MASTWTPSSLQLRLALNHGSFRAAPARANMAKLSRRVRISCVAQNAELGRDASECNRSDHFNGWSDSGDDETTANSRGGDWFSGKLSGVVGMVLVAGLIIAGLSLKPNVLRPKVEKIVTMVADSSSDQISTAGDEGNNVKSQDTPESSRDSSVIARDDIDVDPKDTSTSKGSRKVNKASEIPTKRYTTPAEFDGIGDTHTSLILDEKHKTRSYAGIPAPSTVPQLNPLKPLYPTVVDPFQSQMFAALQALKVIESNALPYDLCTRREFARWVFSASSALSRNSASKLYPAMYIENVTELAFDDIRPEDPDFPFIQGLAEAGLISSKLCNHNMPSARFTFSPESPLSRQDLLSWKMALEHRQLPEADSKKLYQLSGFLDIDKINPEAWPALIADLTAGEHGITALAFGRTRLFQPSKAVTKAQTAMSLAIGEGFEVVSEELARIEAEAMAENAVSAQNALVAQVEKDINSSFEEKLLREKEMVDTVKKLAEEAKSEMARLRAEKEEETLALEKERTSIETEMEALVKLRNELEEQLQSLVNNKAEMSYEKERFDRLQKQVEDENQAVIRLQNELEVEKNALSIARDWAEDEARRARQQGKVLEEARGRWEKYGLKVIVDSDLQEQTTTDSTWLNAGKQYSVEGIMKRAGNLIAKLKKMATDVGGKSREVIYLIIEKIGLLVSAVKEHVHGMEDKAKELEMRTKTKAEEVWKQTSLKIDEMRNICMMKVNMTVEKGRGATKEIRDKVGKLGEKFKSK